MNHFTPLFTKFVIYYLQKEKLIDNKFELQICPNCRDITKRIDLKRTPVSPFKTLYFLILDNVHKKI